MTDILKRIRIIGILTAAVMIMTVSTVLAADLTAADEQYLVSAEFTDSEEVAVDAYGDSDNLLFSYITAATSDIYEIPVLYSSEYNGNKLTDCSWKIYSDLKAEIENVAAGKTTDTRFMISLTESDLSNKTWTAEELGVSALLNADNTVNRDAASAAANLLLENGKSIQAVIRDCPYELYWFGNKYKLQKKYKVSIKRGTDGEKDTLSFTSMSVSIDFLVSGDYKGTDEYTVDISKTGNVGLAVSNAQKIVNDAYGFSDIEKLNYYRMKICELASYDYQSAYASYGKPWQIINVFDGDSKTEVTCEGYAKAFQYLCDLSYFDTYDLYIYSVSGKYETNGGGGGHMWNIVHMNGENYLVDLTNCDGNVPSKKLYMVKPVSGDIDSGYVFVHGTAEYSYVYYDETRLIYGDSELVMNTDHEWNMELVVSQASCLEGSAALFNCTTCNSSKMDNLNDKLDHVPVVIEAVQPSGDKAGATAGIKCSVCNSVITEAVEVPAGTNISEGWNRINNNWYHLDNKLFVQKGWLHDGGWYFLDETGIMLTGWFSDNNGWYYLDNSGLMHTGWIYDGAWYYLDNSGLMHTGWLYDGGWYYLGGNGAMQKGWLWDNGWYYMDNSGLMHTGWLYDGGWYYMNDYGVMATGYQIIDGAEYIFNQNGLLES